MKIKVLGCSGGIGTGLRTTSMLVNDAFLIDAGTGIGDLSLAQLRAIRHIFVTHSHLDHIAGIPLLVDTIFDSLESPLVVHGAEPTLSALRRHVFNDVIWPDFTRIPNAAQPVLGYQTLAPGASIDMDGCRVEAVSVNHVVPAVGYILETAAGCLAFSGDTTTNDGFWARLNELDRLDYLIVESAFPDEDLQVCRLAYHYCPTLLAADLAKLRHQPKIYITHLKPGMETRIMEQCHQVISGRAVEQLSGGEVFEI